MKKKLQKKLALNKNTVSNLDTLSMKTLKGGTEYTDVTCNSCPRTLCGDIGTCGQCITTASQVSNCDCNTLEIECPTGTPPVC